MKVTRPARDWQAYNRQLVSRGKVFSFVVDQAVADEWYVRVAV